MTGYVRKDTSNNIADGNIINAADLDAEFDGVQDAFNSSTGHKHDGTSGEGAPITVVGPVQDVVISATAITPKTTNTVDIGSSSLKFKDFYLAGNANIAGTTTLGGALTYGGVTLSNAVTGTGNMVLSTSPTLTTPTLGVATATSINKVALTAPATGSTLTIADGKTLTANSSLTLAGVDAKTLTVNNSLTLAGTDATTMTFPATSATIARTDAAQTFTGTQTFSGAVSVQGNTTLGDASTDTVTVNGYMGVGGAADSSKAINIVSTALTGSIQYGVFNNIVGTSSATNLITAYIAQPQTAASAFTVANTVGLYVNNVTKGAGSTITNQHGLYIADQTQGTNNYGITSLVSSGSNKWNIYASGTANNAFAGNVRIGSTTAPTNALDVTGAMTVSGNTTLGDASTDTVTVNGYMGVGIAPSVNVGLFTRPSGLTTTTQIGVLGGVLANSAATALVAGVYGEGRTAASAFTVSDLVALYANNTTKGAGSTITNQHGVYIADQTQGTNNYGITSLVSSGANKWNIYASGTAANYFAGNVGIGTSSPVERLTVSGNIALPWTSSGSYSIGVPAATSNTYVLNGVTLEIKGADAIAGSNAMAGGDVLIRGGLGQPNTGLGVFSGDITLRGGTTTAGTDVGAGVIRFETGGTSTERLRIDSSGALIAKPAAGTGAVFNEDGVDADFRVESDTNTHALFVEGSSGNVGVGTSSPTYAFETSRSDSATYAPSSTGAFAPFSASSAVALVRNTSNTASSGAYLGFVGLDGAGTSNFAYIGISTKSSSFSPDIVFGQRTGSTAYTERLRITSDGYLRMASGSLGIQFNGDTAAANALDDYEEGTWLPVFSDASSGGNTATYSSAGGTYTKIGRVVHFTWFVSNINTSGMTGANSLFIQGLPFTSTSSGFTTSSVYANLVTQTANYTTFIHYISTGVAYSELLEVGTNNVTRNVTIGQLASGTADIRVSGTYHV